MTRIIHTKWFHNLILFFRIQQLGRWLLQRLSPTFKYKGIKFRVRSPENFSVAKEIFFENTYTQFLLGNPIRTFIDIGCNTGFFTCLLAAHNDASLLEGILIDADPKVLEETKWHLQTNNLNRCNITYAMIGPANISSAEFYVSDFNITSSAIPFDDTYPFPIKVSQKIEVPVIHLGELIKSKFKDRRINVVKIDIEGSELDLLNQNLAYLGQIDWIILEWHKWVISLDDVTKKLLKYEFKLVEILKEDTICGLALYKNQNVP